MDGLDDFLQSDRERIRQGPSCMTLRTFSARSSTRSGPSSKRQTREELRVRSSPGNSPAAQQVGPSPNYRDGAGRLGRQNQVALHRAPPATTRTNATNWSRRWSHAQRHQNSSSAELTSFTTPRRTMGSPFTTRLRATSESTAFTHSSAPSSTSLRARPAVFRWRCLRWRRCC